MSAGLPAPLLNVSWKRGDREKPRRSVTARGRDMTKRVKIPSEGFEPIGLVQLGWRGELPAWRQAEPTL